MKATWLMTSVSYAATVLAFGGSAWVLPGATLQGTELANGGKEHIFTNGKWAILNREQYIWNYSFSEFM